MTKVYFLSKALHRLTIYLVTFLAGCMTATGLLLKYPLPALTQFLNLELFRFIHNKLSLYFALALFVMIVTGIYMYLFPILRRRNL